MGLKAVVVWLLVPCAAMAGELERWDRAVCLWTERGEPPTDNNVEIASAFLVQSGDYLHLLTAAHTARLTDARTPAV